jgi:formylmethanofuran dehydrogenase subunit A
MGNAPTHHQPLTKTPPPTALEERKTTSVSNSFVMANIRQHFSSDGIATTHEPFGLVGGTIHDPATGRDGIVADIWIEAGRIVPPPADTSRFRQIDAAGLVVMPGGVDLHSHVAGPKVNAGRRIAPQLASSRRGNREPAAVPTIHRTGTLYAALGYTTVFDAAIATGAAGIATLELAEMPILDKGFYLLAADDAELLAALDKGDSDTISRLVWDAVSQGGGWGVKVANPGGPAFWKRSRGDHHDLDTPLPGYSLTGRSLLERLARGVSAVGLPHPLHIHTANLGLPGNWRTLAETMRTLDGIPAHLAHVQFHSYTGGDLDANSFGSGVPELAAWFNDHEGLTLDVGQVLFGDTVAMTGDSAAAEHLAHTTGMPWHSHDLWLEGGCGVLPIAYKEKSLIHAWQWAIGLEWFLSITDPWRLVLSTDHPNGAHFTAYPVLMQLLGDAAFRQAAFERIHPAVRKRSPLAHLDREYSLQELCIITRAAPARIAGLPQKGQLGVGADADITLYRPSHDLAAMFAMPAAVYKGGQLVAENGHTRATPTGRQLRAIAAHDAFISELNG